MSISLIVIVSMLNIHIREDKAHEKDNILMVEY